MSGSSENGRRATTARAGRGRRGWQVQVLVDPRADAAAIARHLERFGCHVVGLRPPGLVLELPNASGSANAEAEARLYLAMWHAHHPPSPNRAHPASGMH